MKDGDANNRFSFIANYDVIIGQFAFGGVTGLLEVDI